MGRQPSNQGNSAKSKKRRGTKGWQSEAQDGFFHTYLYRFFATQAAKTFNEFWGTVSSDFFERWPTELTEKDLDNGITTIEEKQKIELKLIKTWFNNHAKEGTRAAMAPDNTNTKKDVLDFRQRKPKRLPASQAYSLLYYDDRVREVFNKRWEEKKALHQAGILNILPNELVFRNQVTKEMLDAETQAVKDEVEEHRNRFEREQDDSNADVDNGGQAVDNAEVRRIAKAKKMMEVQAAAPKKLTQILEQLHRDGGYIGGIVLAAPDPLRGGDLKILSFFSGKGEDGRDWGHDYGGERWHHKIEIPLGAYAHKFYTESERQAFALPGTERSSTPHSTTARGSIHSYMRNRQASATSRAPASRSTTVVTNSYTASAAPSMSPSLFKESTRKYIPVRCDAKGKGKVKVSAPARMPASDMREDTELAEIMGDPDEDMFTGFDGDDTDWSSSPESGSKEDGPVNQLSPSIPDVINTPQKIRPSWDNGIDITPNTHMRINAMGSDYEKEREMNIIRNSRMMGEDLRDAVAKISSEMKLKRKSKAGRSKDTSNEKDKVSEQVRRSKRVALAEREQQTEQHSTPIYDHTVCIPDKLPPNHPSQLISAEPPANTRLTDTHPDSGKWPLWLYNAVRSLETLATCEDWERVLNYWIIIEKRLGYPTGGQSKKYIIDKTHRPAEVASWFKHARNFEDMPDVTERVHGFADDWWAWWSHLQPEWRGNGPDFALSPPEDFSEWTELEKGGPNGIFVLVLTLAWWAVAVVDQDDATQQHWNDALTSFGDVLEHITEHTLVTEQWIGISSAQVVSHRKRGTSSVESDPPTSKKRKF